MFIACRKEAPTSSHSIDEPHRGRAGERVEAATALRSRRNTTHAEVLDLQVVLDAVLRTFAPGTGFLDSAERRHLVGDDALVDADHAVLESFGHLPDTADVSR